MNLNNLSPIVLFTYNRPKHTYKVLEALKTNELSAHSTLFVYQDGKKDNNIIEDNQNWNLVNELISSIKGFKKVIIRVSDTNLGCDPSMIKGITDVVNEYGKIIVLEDDLVVSPHFLNYMNISLDYYNDIEEVGSINGYSYKFKKKLPEFFFQKGVNPYGWATWKKYWEMYNPNADELVNYIIENKLVDDFNYGDTLGILKNTILNPDQGGRDAIWYASLYRNNILGLFPSKSFVNNIGFDSSGTHTNNINEKIVNFQWPISELNNSFSKPQLLKVKVLEHKKTKRYIQKIYNELSGKTFGLKRVKKEYFLIKHRIKMYYLKIFKS